MFYWELEHPNADPDRSGIIYQDKNIKVEVCPVKHGSFEAYGYKFYTLSKTNRGEYTYVR